MDSVFAIPDFSDQGLKGFDPQCFVVKKICEAWLEAITLIETNCDQAFSLKNWLVTELTEQVGNHSASLIYQPYPFAWLAHHTRGSVSVNDLETLAQSFRDWSSHPKLGTTSVSLIRNPEELIIRQIKAVVGGLRGGNSSGCSALTDNELSDTKYVEDLEGALELLCNFAPGYFQDVLIFNSSICLINEQASFGSITSQGFLGLIASSPSRNWNIVRWCEEIVHETSHIILHCLDLLSPLLEGNEAYKKVHPSPIRSDPRSHFGNFHALFVVSRLKRLYELLILGGCVSKSEKRHLELIQKSYHSFSLLRDYKGISPLGRDILTKLIQPAITDEI